MFRPRFGKIKIKVTMVGIAVGILIFSVTCAAQTQRTKQLPPESEAINAYRTQAEFIQSEIKSLRSNLKWLELKIKDMEDMKRPISYKLIESVKFKKSKIASLTAVLNRYERLGQAKSRESESGRLQSVGPASQAKKTASHLPCLLSMSQKLKSAGLGDWMRVTQKNTGLNMENSLPILFSSGSAKLSSGYDSFLKKLAVFLKGRNVRIAIRGYADTDPIGTEQYPSNFELGAARASAVVHKLTSYGVKPSIFRVVTTGEHRVDNAHKKTKWKNLQRHVNILITLLPGNVPL